MFQYAILANPGHNRIYFDTAVKIACSELKAILDSMGLTVTEVTEKEIGLPAAWCLRVSKNLMRLS